MDEPLKELKRQRELIRQHLEWLDRRIAEEDSAAPPPSGQADATDAAGAKAAPIPPEATAKSPRHATPAPAAPLQDPVLQEALRAERAGREEGLLSGMSDVDKAKYGCLILFVLGVGIFLFLLFGLPALMD